MAMAYAKTVLEFMKYDLAQVVGRANKRLPLIGPCFSPFNPG
jgi:hypothetical protein